MGLFGGEKITLRMERYDYHPGDIIKGTVSLNLAKPTKARKLEIAFIGDRIQTGMQKSGSKSNRMNIYNFRIPLDGEKEYVGGEYSFEIKIPPDILGNEPKLEGKLGAAVSAIKILSGSSSRIEWYVKAQLDVPLGINVAKVQQIMLSAQTSPPGGL